MDAMTNRRKQVTLGSTFASNKEVMEEWIMSWARTVNDDVTAISG
jgi:hypothetical protein